MTVNFVERPNGPQRLVCDAELHFGPEAGPLEGLKLVGFALWRSAEGEVFVSLPARPFGSGGERRYFDLLRSATGNGEGTNLRRWILEQFRAQAGHLA